ncbi:hypothetical protein B566_EDAN001717 [Ephemera danica]|nr:hypothetical protein B566_EDAN001717 [Ephemera danica]
MHKKQQLRAMTVTASPPSQTNYATAAQSMPHLECMERFNQLPVVETAVDAVGKFYHRLKRSNSMAEWTLNTAEAGMSRMAHTLVPPLTVPLQLADSALCLSLTLVEDNLPAVKLPPQQILASMRSMVRDGADALTRPVLRRASSVRELAARRVHEARDIGLQHANQVMRTRVGSIAADQLEKGLGLAEQLLDTYLPDCTVIGNGVAGEDQTDCDDLQQEQEEQEQEEDDENNRALHTVHRVDRLTRKFQRRIKHRTLAQVKSLREHELSHDEPENQPPPETLEQRTMLLIREAARRVVHAVNAVAAMPVSVAATCSQLLLEILHGLRLDGPVHALRAQSQLRYEQLETLLRQLSSFTDQFLVGVVQQWKRLQQVQQQQENNHHQSQTTQTNHVHVD